MVAAFEIEQFIADLDELVEVLRARFEKALAARPPIGQARL